MPDFVPDNHPRAASLRIREKLVKGFEEGLVAKAGLFAHGRGEAFDYFLGEKTTEIARQAIKVASALLLLAKRPVISVNGNATALVPESLVELSWTTGAPIEVNLFYRTSKRERLIADELIRHGAKDILGLGPEQVEIDELSHLRRIVDPKGILIADVVLVPLEDGDRTEALVKMGKRVIAVDLNPLSRTSQAATISVVDNIVRCLPILVETTKSLKKTSKAELRRLLERFNNQYNLRESLKLILSRFPRNESV